MDLPPSDYLPTAFYALFASVAGVLGYAMRTVEKGLKVKWRRTLLEGCSAGFVGGLAHMACLALEISGPWVGVVVGTLGWLGSSASIVLLEKIVYKKLGIDKSNFETPQEDHE